MIKFEKPEEPPKKKTLKCDCGKKIVYYEEDKQIVEVEYPGSSIDNIWTLETVGIKCLECKRKHYVKK
jgi:hypothetical protein